METKNSISTLSYLTLFNKKKDINYDHFKDILENIVSQNLQIRISKKGIIIYHAIQLYSRIIQNYSLKLLQFKGQILQIKDHKKSYIKTNHKRVISTIKKVKKFDKIDGQTVEKIKNLEELLAQELSSQKNTQMQPNDNFITIKKQSKFSQNYFGLQDSSIPPLQKFKQQLDNIQNRDIQIPRVKVSHISQNILQEYKKILTENDKDKSNNQQSERKKVQKTRKKHQPKLLAQIDIKVDLSQEGKDKEELQNILTKTKYKKQQQNSDYKLFKQIVNRKSQQALVFQKDFWKKKQNLLDLDYQLMRFQETRWDSNIKRDIYENFYVSPDLASHLSSQSKSDSNGGMESFKFLIQSQEEKKNIQLKVQNMIKEQLKQGSFSLNSFMDKKSFSKSSKSGLFYQILALQFTLQQKNPQRFSEIIIVK